VIIKIKYEQRDKHVHTRIFMGHEVHHVALCGNLIFNPAEFELFVRTLKGGCLLTKGVEVVVADVADGSSSSYPKIQLPPEDPPKK